ncbi:MAG: hypothetical protein LV481_16320 [Methylacidiphilales bacterium]|nr:hypothetical protein [Candidatus Methylacidiphilales bacterium]
MNLFIIDQNRLRSDALDDRLHYSTPADLFVLIDTAFVEMCKGKAFEIASNKNFMFLREHPSKVAVGSSISELLRQELHTRKPTSDIINPNLTDAFRLYLEELRTHGQARPRHAKLMELVTLHQDSLADGALNIAKKRADLQSTLDSWKQNLSPEDLQSLRSHRWTDKKWLSKSGVAAANGAIQLLIENGWSRDEAVAFCKLSPLFFRFQLAFNNLALHWLEHHGLPTAKDDTVLNDLLDMEYVVSATYAKELVTIDQKAGEQLALLNRLLEKATN